MSTRNKLYAFIMLVFGLLMISVLANAQTSHLCQDIDNHVMLRGKAGKAGTATCSF